jgi:hypothetical protein
MNLGVPSVLAVAGEHQLRLRVGLHDHRHAARVAGQVLLVNQPPVLGTQTPEGSHRSGVALVYKATCTQNSKSAAAVVSAMEV